MLQKNKIKLSIIIPVFNEELFINQLYLDILKYFNKKNIEVIFINDGSTDNSKQILENLINKHSNNFQLIVYHLENNTGKGNAVRTGMKYSKGEYILLQDADLELDVKDSNEIYEIIINDSDIKCIFGSRYLSGKLKKHNYFVNQLINKINTFLFNILFGQSLTDIHCGLKIMHRDVYEKLNLSINDFGLEIDIASQIIKKNFFIYEVGVSYFSRTIKAGKKITWLDGLKSYYYLFKVRFVDNTFSTKLSILISSLYMPYIGSNFSIGLGKILFIFIFFIAGLIIGLNNKIFSNLVIFVFVFVGSYLGTGFSNLLSILIFLLLGILFATKILKLFLYNNKILSKII